MRKAFAVISAVAAVAFIALLAVLSRSPVVHAGGGYEAGIALSGQTVSIPLTQIQCGSGIPCPAGLYRATISCITEKKGIGKVSVELDWSNFGNVQTANSGTCALNTVGANSGISFPMYSDGVATPIYKATVSAGPGSATWRMNVVLERLQ